MTALRPCHACGHSVAVYTRRCPNCGQKNPGANGSIRGNRVMVLVLIVIALAFLFHH
jgi:hypothetical protein